jgi:hypothetical protein
MVLLSDGHMRRPRPLVSALDERAGTVLRAAFSAGGVGNGHDAARATVEQLAALQPRAEAPLVIAVVVPLKRESHDAVRALLRGGPPFDPEEVTGLERHEVLLTAEEAIFLFEPRLGADALTSLVSEPSLWQVAAAWRYHLAGPPRLAEEVYSWASGAESDELSYLPTPGPGDSDGGDIF